MKDESVRVRLSLAVLVAWVFLGEPGFAQPARFEVGGQIAVVDSSEFEETDLGLGGRFAWRPIPLIGLEAEFDFYPADFPGRGPISTSRLEGLFGMTVGPALPRARPFARIRAGFLDFRPAPGPVACILIYPPPLTCTLAAGRTMPLVDLGGGVEVPMTPRTFLRLDVGERLIKYPGPAFDSKRHVRQTAYWGHDLRVAAGGGVRF